MERRAAVEQDAVGRVGGRAVARAASRRRPWSGPSPAVTERHAGFCQAAGGLAPGLAQASRPTARGWPPRPLALRERRPCPGRPRTAPPGRRSRSAPRCGGPNTCPARPGTATKKSRQRVCPGRGLEVGGEAAPRQPGEDGLGGARGQHHRCRRVSRRAALAKDLAADLGRGAVLPAATDTGNLCRLDIDVLRPGPSRCLRCAAPCRAR